MGKFIDLTGQKFNRLTVIKRLGSQCKSYQWLCLCDCGKYTKVLTHALKNGSTKSCGCLKREKTIERNLKHNLSNTRLHKIWLGIKKRCTNKNCNAYKKYGGRGITICDNWKNDFMAFYNWSISNGYNEYLSIDRIDVNGNYEPSNCRWATIEQQANNKRTNRNITYNGTTKTLSEWAKMYNINYKLLHSRLKKGWSIKNALELKPFSHSESGKMAFNKQTF